MLLQRTKFNGSETQWSRPMEDLYDVSVRTEATNDTDWKKKRIVQKI